MIPTLERAPLAFHPGYVLNNFYAGIVSVGISNNVIGAIDALYAYPVLIHEPVVTDTLGFRVQTGGASGNAKLGLFAHDRATKRPGVRLATTAGAAVGTASAEWTGAITALALNPGVYWLAGIFDALISAVCIATTSGLTAGMLGGAVTRGPMPVGASTVGLVRTGGTISYANGIPATWTALGGTDADVVLAQCPIFVWKKSA